MAYLFDQCPSCGKWIELCSPAQRTAFRMVCETLGAQLEWPPGSGHKLNVRQWKQLLVATWERSEEKRAEFFPALDGEGIDWVFRRDAGLSKQEMSHLIEFGFAQGAERGVRFREPR